MNRSKSIFPTWAIIMLAIIWLAVIIGIAFSIATKALEFIPTIIITAVIASANIILVYITKNYAIQTTKMADATKRMLEYYHETRKNDLMPLFVPIGTQLSKRTPKDNHFSFYNVGNIALLVEVETEWSDATYKQSQSKVESGEFMFFKGTANQPAFLKNPPEMLYIAISFSDRMLNRYRQIVKYNCKWNRFYFDKSSLPIEQISSQ